MFRKTYLPLLILLFSTVFAKAQDVKLSGFLFDENTQETLFGASIILSDNADSNYRLFTSTDQEGKFVFDGLNASAYNLKISFIGYEDLVQLIFISGDTILGRIPMKPAIEDLEEIQVTDNIPMAVQKGDTVQFNADAFKTNPDATAEDLVKKMPGIVVDDENIQAMGEDVKKVLVDGRPFFGDDPRLALRTIPADVIEKIEVYDKLSDQAEFTGFDDGQSVKTMNIITRPETRNGQFGRVYAGYGTDNRYNVGGNINLFDDDRRISIVGLSNNVNQQNFSTEDLLGIMSSGSRKRGPGGGGGGGGGRQGGGSSPSGTSRPQGGSANDFMTGPQDGISNTHSAGINYTDKWGEKVEFNGSYFFNISDNNTDESLIRENILPGESNLYYDELSSSTNTNYNHRFNFKIDYKIDSFNSILFRPKLSLQSNTYSSDVEGFNSLASGEAVSSTINNYNDKTQGYNFNNDLLYRHSFRKKGRTLSADARTGFNNSASDNDLIALNNYYDDQSNTGDTINQVTDANSDGYNLSAKLMYTEPIRDFGQLFVEYSSSYSKNYSLAETYNYDYDYNTYSVFDTTLSSEFNNDYFTNGLGTGLRFNTSKMNLMAGLSVQRSDLISNPVFPESLQLEKKFISILPNAMLRYTFSRSSNLRVFYRSNTNAPSLTQLQDIVDNSNPLSMTAGNPDLKQEYSNMLMARYSLSKIRSSKFMYLLVYIRNTQNYIGSATYTAANDTLIGGGLVLNRGSQLTIPVNADGFWNARTFFTFGFPISKIKSNLNLNTGVTYARTPGIINGNENISHSWLLSQGVVLGSNISEKLDFTISYSASYNISNNSIQDELNNNYFYQSTGLDFTWIFWKGIVFRNTLKHQLYTGLSEELNDSYLLWNIEVGKKFLKNQAAEVKIGVYDLLDQNKSISRTVNESYIEDSIVEVLQRYAMLSFTYNLKNFKSNERNRNL